MAAGGGSGVARLSADADPVAVVAADLETGDPKRSLVAFKTYGRHKKEYPSLFTLPEHKHLMVVHIKSQREAEQFLDSFTVEQPVAAVMDL